MKEEIIKYIEDNGFTFDGEEDNDLILTFSTREHGDSNLEEPGQEDLQKAIEIKKELKLKYPSIEATSEIVDEWVYVEVRNYDT